MVVQHRLCVLIPAYNEQTVLAKTIESVLAQISRHDLYIVDDGSHDNTAKMAHNLLPPQNFLRISNSGKANALNIAIQHFNLTDKYDFIMPLDADCILGPNFVYQVMQAFDQDQHNRVVAITTQVQGTDKNWITGYRMAEYLLAQTVHKQAQSYIGGVTVMAGCSTIFRSALFKQQLYPIGTVTEDMDLTFTIQQKSLGTIQYLPNVFVQTQDPNNLNTYFKQISRWYRGYWQSVLKHRLPNQINWFNFEVLLAGLEGLFSSLLILFSPIILMYLIHLGQWHWIVIALIIDVIITLLPASILAFQKNHNWKFFLWLPGMYFLRSFASIYFIKALLSVAFAFDTRYGTRWNTARYNWS